MLNKSCFYTSRCIRIIMAPLVKYESSSCRRFDSIKKNFRSLQYSTKKIRQRSILGTLQNGFSTITKTMNEAQVLDELFLQEQIIDKANQDLQTDLNVNENKKKSHEEYIDYLRIFKENKRRLSLAQQISKRTDQAAPSIPFDQDYLRDNLIETKYFYTDIVNVSTCVVEDLINRIEHASQQQSSLIVTPTHLHLLLYVYHLYPHESRNFKERMARIMDYFFNCFDSTLAASFKMEKNLQLFVYFRKFIEAEIGHGNGSQLSTLISKYCLLLKNCHQHEKQAMQLIFQTSEDKDKFVHQATLRAQLIHNYLLAFPNVWILNKNNSQQDKAHQKHLKSSLSISEQTLEVFDNFVSEFSTLFSTSIESWMNLHTTVPTTGALTSTISSKAQLSLQFKELQLNKCYNQMKLIIHRLFAIVQVPRTLSMTKNNTSSSNNQSKLKREKEKQTQQQIILIHDKYIRGKINLLNYLPSPKFNTHEQIKIMRLLILIKNLLSYHVLRHIDDQQLTNYLVQLFQHNSATINSPNQDLKRDIKFLIGELVSRLCSGSWVDHDDRLNKYFENSNLHNQETKNKGRRDNKGEWYAVNDS